MEVFTFPLDLRIYTNGYLFREKTKPRKLNIQAVGNYPEIEICDYENLKRGRDFELSNGEIIPNEALTLEPEKSFSYAFCSDTRYKPDIVPIIKDVDILYHEATFLSDLQEMAQYTGHSTAREAATIARDANAGKLILGHFSNRYKNTNVLLEEAQSVFENTIIPVQFGVYEPDHEILKLNS